MLTTNAGVGLSLLADVGIDVIVVEHKDRFARIYGLRRTHRKTEKLILELAGPK